MSIDKNKDRFIDTGTRKITVFPDTPAEMKSYIENSGLLLIEQFETEFAHIFIAENPIVVSTDYRVIQITFW